MAFIKEKHINSKCYLSLSVAVFSSILTYEQAQNHVIMIHSNIHKSILQFGQLNTLNLNESIYLD